MCDIKDLYIKKRHLKDIHRGNQKATYTMGFFKDNIEYNLECKNLLQSCIYIDIYK